MDILTIWFPKYGPYSASCGNKDKKHRVTYSICLSVTRFMWYLSSWASTSEP